MGTPGYVAPEQALGSAALTPACDIYALGVVLFELITGRLPFEADTPMGVVLKHLYDDPPRPSSLRPELPAALDAVVLKALRKEPADRYRSAGDLAAALRSAWPNRPPASPALAVKSAPSAPVRKSEAQPRPDTPRPPRSAASSAPVRKSEAQPRPDAPRSSRKSEAQPRPDTPRAARSARPNTISPPTRNPWPLRIGLITADVVGVLILFGRYPNALNDAWQNMLRLVGM
jgi:serine/threonine protein kinase